MSAATVVRACIRAQTGSTPPDGAQLSNLGVDTKRLEGCLNDNLPLPPGIPYARGSIDPLWTVAVLIEDARARMSVGRARVAPLMAVMPLGGGGQLAHFRIGKAPKRQGGGKGKAANKPKRRPGGKGGGAGKSHAKKSPDNNR